MTGWRRRHVRKQSQPHSQPFNGENQVKFDILLLDPDCTE